MDLKIKLKHLVVFFCFNAVLLYNEVSYAYSLAHQVTYKIEPDMIPHCVNVNGTIQGGHKGSYLLRLPRQVSNLIFKVDDEILTYFKTADDKVINLKHPAAKEIKFQYKSCISNLNRSIEIPILEKDITHFNTATMLITPESDLQQTALLGIDISTYPNEFQTITSYNINQRKFLVHTSIASFREAAIAIGKFTIDKQSVADKQIFVVSNGSWSYLEQSPSQYIKKLIKTQRNFWNDHYFPHYVVFLIKQNTNYPVPNYIMGRHWNNFSVMLMPEEAKLVPLLLYSLSHESLHAWVGKKMQIEYPQGSLQWFIEGINDFYGLYFANNSEMISIADYILIYNKFIKEYMLSPLKEVSNQTIKEKFQFKNEFDYVAQLRGHFLGKQLRDKVNSPNGNKLDLAMKALFERNQREKWPYVTEDNIDLVFKEYVGEANWNDFKASIHSGKAIQFSKDAFYPYAELKQVNLKVPDFGFNLHTLFYDKVIADINPKSNAYLAGLRDGHKVLNQDIDCKAYDKVVHITIEDNGAQKMISFQPEVVKKVIPQYVMLKSTEKFTF